MVTCRITHDAASFIDPANALVLFFMNANANELNAARGVMPASRLRTDNLSFSVNFEAEK
jgi:hypothetical protein